jgi:hypothetical protein
MMTLANAPGGARLIESLGKAIADLALLYAHTDDGRARASLMAYVQRIEPELVAGVGAGPARVILEAFAAAVMGEKHKIEALAASRA